MRYRKISTLYCWQSGSSHHHGIGIQGPGWRRKVPTRPCWKRACAPALDRMQSIQSVVYQETGKWDVRFQSKLVAVVSSHLPRSRRSGINWQLDLPWVHDAMRLLSNPKTLCRSPSVAGAGTPSTDRMRWAITVDICVVILDIESWPRRCSSNVRRASEKKVRLYSPPKTLSVYLVD